MNSRSCAAIITMFLAVSSATAQTAAKPAEAAPKLAASINGETLSVAELDRLYERLSPEMRKNYDRAGGKMLYLENYIGKRLILQEAIKANFDRRPEVAEDLRAARESVLFDRYVKDVVAAQFVTEAKLREYYEAHKTDYDRGEMIKARHILATPDAGDVHNVTRDDAVGDEQARAKIEKVALSLQRGANFADLASKYSEDGTAMSGGDLGWFGKGKMVEEFEEAVFKLGKGQLSGVVKTRYGYHVVYVEDRRDAGPAPFEEVRDQVRERVLSEHAEEVLAAVNSLTRALRTDSSITIYRENF